ncbi:hypothetical protein EAI89_07780 [Eubacterium sp. am_0171]|nr:hypothetical protein EAI89_07780 [Eubacterium sp. am_0171]
MRRLPADCVCHFRGLKVRGLESVREKTGNIEGRICFTKTNSVAAGGANASAFGPTAASTLNISCFFSYGFSANGRFRKWHTQSAGSRLTFYDANVYFRIFFKYYHYYIFGKVRWPLWKMEEGKFVSASSALCLRRWLWVFFIIILMEAGSPLPVREL